MDGAATSRPRRRYSSFRFGTFFTYKTLDRVRSDNLLSMCHRNTANWTPWANREFPFKVFASWPDKSCTAIHYRFFAIWLIKTVIIDFSAIVRTFILTDYPFILFGLQLLELGIFLNLSWWFTFVKQVFIWRLLGWGWFA